MLELKIERYYSPSENKYYEAPIPEKYLGTQFGPDLKSFILLCSSEARVTDNKIHSMLTAIGLRISPAQISNILVETPQIFEEEMKKAKLEAQDKAGFLHIDKTGAKIKGLGGATFSVGNQFFSSFYTSIEQGRKEAIMALGIDQLKAFVFTKAFTKSAFLLELPSEALDLIMTLCYSEITFNESEFEKILVPRFKKLNLSKKRINDIRTFALLGAYKSNIMGPPVRAIISDDGKEFKGLAKIHALCWIHEIRHYRVLSTHTKVFREFHLEFIKGLWDFYDSLKEYKENPNAKAKWEIIKRFDEIFSGDTGFTAINSACANTRSRKVGLLIFLDHPYLPLHNNMCESDIKLKVIKRKISCGNKSLRGARSQDILLGVLGTCKKLHINYYHFLQDRLNNRYAIDPLSEIIRKSA